LKVLGIFAWAEGPVGAWAVDVAPATAIRSGKIVRFESPHESPRGGMFTGDLRKQPRKKDFVLFQRARDVIFASRDSRSARKRRQI